MTCCIVLPLIFSIGVLVFLRVEVREVSRSVAMWMSLVVVGFYLSLLLVDFGAGKIKDMYTMESKNWERSRKRAQACL
jgi:hypothetical protein